MVFKNPLPQNIELIPYSEQVDHSRVPAANSFILERHVPTLFDRPYHHHTSIEINFLENCEMDYSFSGKKIALQPGRITVFWGASPHLVTDVRGKGIITNIYLSLGQFIRWGLPSSIVNILLSGGVIASKAFRAQDKAMMDMLYHERNQTTPNWRRMHLVEIENRLRRLGLEGWDILLEPKGTIRHAEATSQAMLHVEAMLRYISENYTAPIKLVDIANATNLSIGRASDLFKNIMGITIKQQLQRARLSHARMLLSETDDKVASIALDVGFSSLSAFYEAFTIANHMTPAKYRSLSRRPSPFVAEHSIIDDRQPSLDTDSNDL